MASTNEVKAVLNRLGVETPSWAYGNSGTRFKVFGQPGVPRDPYEKVADAAQVHKYTGAAPTVALHIPWDKVADYKDFAKHAEALGVKLGTINSNTFQDDQYILGSVCAPDPKVRANAVALLHCMALGPKAMVVVYTGHHAQGTNIEFIVAGLLRAKRLGAFDFNSRFYADDDLIVGAADPFQLFRIMHEVNINGGFDVGTPVSYVLDQCHNIEAKIPGQIRSIMNVQEAVAKAVLVDQDALKKAQLAGDVLAGHEVLMDAYNTDVRGLLREWRGDKGIDPEPMKAYAASGYAKKIATDRVGGNQAGWGA